MADSTVFEAFLVLKRSKGRGHGGVAGGPAGSGVAGMRSPELRGSYELVGDLFAGGGGASMGIELSTGRPVDFAINHSPAAIAMHMANHPDTEHYQEDVWGVDPQSVTKGRPLGLLWASPDCTHHSNARGGKPKDKNIRGLPWVVTRWAAKARPRVIMLENVREFESWGPLNRRHHPRRNKRGQTFRRFVAQLQALGYEVQFRKLIAANYGAPTSRLRLFMIARCDGEPIVWPTPTHAPRESAEVRAGLLQPWRAAYECIDFSIPCPSIFLTREQGRAIGVNRPLVPATLRRIAAGLKRFVLEDPEPFIVGTAYAGANGQYVNSIHEPLSTLTTRPSHGLVTPYVVRNNHDGQGKPSDTLAFMVAYFGQEKDGGRLTDPMRTVTSKERFGLVYVQGVPYEIVDIGMRMFTPRELFRAQGFPEEYVIDVWVPEHFDPDAKRTKKAGWMNKTEQIAACGNSVPPAFSRALVEANYRDDRQRELWRGYELAVAGGAM